MKEPSRLLLVNDDDDGLFLMIRAMKQEFPRAEILSARSAREAVAALEKGRVDLMVTDNRMPIVSGIALIRALRATGQVMPIAMVTGSAELEKEARAAGATAFISGADWKDVRQAVRTMFERSDNASSQD